MYYISSEKKQILLLMEIMWEIHLIMIWGKKKKKKKNKEEEDSTAKWNRNHTTYEGDLHNIWGNEEENSEVFAQIGPLKSQPILKPDIWLADVRCLRHIPTIDCYTSWIKWVPVGMTLGRVDSSSLGLDWIALILLHVHAWFK